MFKYKKYTMQFEKQCFPLNSYSLNYKEVADNSLVSTLVGLQKKYEFKIISMNFQECFRKSTIKIKCKKEDKCKIFSEYCKLLGNNICNISF